MATIIDILKQIFSATDDQTAAFSAAMKENSIYTASEENLDIRHKKLKEQHTATEQQLGEANKLIETLKASEQGNANLQQQLSAYEQKMQQMAAELEQAKVDAAVKVGLLSENAVDVDYLAFKLREKMKADGEELKLDDNGVIKGWADKLESLKTLCPAMFKASSDKGGDGYKVVEPNRLKGDKDTKQLVTREQYAVMGYDERMALKQQNAERYNALRKQ